MEAPHLNLGSKLGAAFLGNLAAGIFYGVTNVQTFIYYKNTHKDGRSLQFLVFFLWVLDGVHLALVTHIQYFYMVSNFANPSALVSPVWSVLAQVYVTCISDLIVRSIFGRRVWLLSGRNNLLALAIGVTSLLTAVSGFVFAARSASGTFAEFSKTASMLYTALGSGVVADIIITGSLCTLLSRSRTGFKRTDSLVNVLMVYTINTGLLTTICTTACLITYAIWPDEFTFIGIYFSLPKLYLNSLLATLNARTALREQPYSISTVPIGLSERSSKFMSHAEAAQAGSYMEDARPKIVVTIDRQVETSTGSESLETYAR